MKIFLGMIILLASCSSTRKSMTTTLQEVDSTGLRSADTASLKTADSSRVVKDSSLSTISAESEYEKKTEEEELEGILGKRDSGIKAIGIDPADYFPPGTKVKVTKRTTYEKGKAKAETKTQLYRSDSVSTHKVDSTAGHKVDSSTLKKKVKEQSKQVKRTRFLPGVFWWLIILLILFIGYRYYLFKKKGVKLFEWGHNKQQT